MEIGGSVFSAWCLPSRKWLRDRLHWWGAMLDFVIFRLDYFGINRLHVPWHFCFQTSVDIFKNVYTYGCLFLVLGHLHPKGLVPWGDPMGCMSSPEQGVFLQTCLCLPLPLIAGSKISKGPQLGSMAVVVKAVRGHIPVLWVCLHSILQQRCFLFLHRKLKSLLGPSDTFNWDEELRWNHCFKSSEFILQCSLIDLP